MRVLIDATYAARAPRSGTAVYANALIGALAELTGVEPQAVANRRRPAPGGGGPASAVNLLADAIWGLETLPRLARARRAWVVHHTLPGPMRAGGLPQVVTVHDLAFEALPERFDAGFRRYAHLVHRAAARRADVVICVSDATATEVRERWGVARERIVVAHHGPGQALPAPQPAGGRSHFLYVGDAEPRKDLPTLLAAHQRLREQWPQAPELVLAGETGVRGGDGVQTVADVSRERLAELLAGAIALVHPALHEGFGLTVLEAMQAGTPVIAARSAAVAEVAREAALLVSPANPAALAAAMRRLASDPGVSERLREAGRRRAQTFSWAASARAHADAYSLAVTMHRGHR